MELFNWVTGSWFLFLQSAGIIGGLLFTAVSLQIDARVRRVGNLISLTQHHRDIWTRLYSTPGLARVLDANVDLKRTPVTIEEELFINLLILHLNSAYQAMQHGMFMKPESLGRDIRTFFSLPIPQVVWETSKPFQDEAFVTFVETNQTGS